MTPKKSLPATQKAIQKNAVSLLFDSEVKVKKQRGKGVRFKPNNPETGERDERINRKGTLVPKDQRELNLLIDELLSEKAEVKDSGKIIKMQKIRVILNKLMLSKSPAGQIYILDRRYGKLPQAVELSAPEEGLIIKIVKASESTNSNQ